VSGRRVWVWPLAPVYAAGIKVKDGLRAAGLLKTRRLRWPVVSVGSLSAGGAGKTPVAMALAELLQERGWTVDVLSRGYGREGRGVERVEEGVADAARRFGDEPVMMARRTGVPVWVGAERFAAGVEAERAGAVSHGEEKRVHLLDDGFQHRGLARNLDVVLVTEEDLDDTLLPVGNRREPLSALQRADVVVLREEERARVEPRVRRWMREDAALWTIRRTVVFREDEEVVRQPGGLVAFCAIARPEGFFEMLRGEGTALASAIAFPDHHSYNEQDISRLVESWQANSGSGFVTTEKDAVKITPEMRARLEAVGPLHIAELQAAFTDPGEVVRGLEARLT